MPLGPKERRRIYEEEKARIEADTIDVREKPPIRWWLFAAILGVVALLLIISKLAPSPSGSTLVADTSASTNFSSAPSVPPSPEKHATLKVVVTTYEIPSYNQSNDEVKVQGSVENMGPDNVFSPDLIGDLVAKDGTLLGQDITWPAGQSFSTMAVGTKAEFSMLIFSHGADIKAWGAGVNLWSKAKDVTLDITWPKH